MKNLKIWQFQFVEWLAYLVIFMIPLVVSKELLFGFTSFKSFIFTGLIALMIIFLSWGLWKVKNIPIQIGWVHITLLAFVLVTSVSGFLGVDPNTSFFGNFMDGVGLIYIYTCLFFSLIVSFLIKNNEKFLIKFLIACFLGGLIVAFKSYGGDHNSTLGNTSFTGAYLLFISCIGIGVSLYVKETWQKVLFWISTFFVFISPVFINLKGLGSVFQNPTNILGEAKGATVGLGISIIIIVALFFTQDIKKWKKYLGWMLIVMTLLSIFFVGSQLVKDGTKINQEFISGHSASRFVYWDIAKKGLKDRPVLGYGWGNYDMVFQNHFNPIIFSPGYPPEGSIRDPHNIFWSLASTTGILGVIAYFSLIGLVCIIFYKNLREGNREKRIFGIVSIGILFGYVVQNLFVFDTITSFILFFSIVGFAISYSKPIWDWNIKDTIWKKITLSLVVLFSMLMIIFLTILPWKESLIWSRYFLDPSITNPQHVSFVGSEGDTVFIASKILVAIRERSDTPEKKQKAIEILNILKDSLANEITRSPNNYKIYLAKGLIESTIASFSFSVDKKWNTELLTEAKKDLEKAMELNPKNQETFLGLIRVNIYERDFDEAYKNLKTAFEINPEYTKMYDAAETLLRLSPNKEFEEFLNSKMKENNIVLP